MAETKTFVPSIQTSLLNNGLYVKFTTGFYTVYLTKDPPV